MTDSMAPEMQRTPVEELCLQVRSLQLPGDIATVLGKALAPPSQLAVSHAVALLRSLGALDDDEELTTLGWKLSAMPVHPSLGKMLLLGSLFGCMPQLLSVGATLSAKNPFVLPFGKEREADQAKQKMGIGLNSDHLLFAKVSREFMAMSWRQRHDWCHCNFLSDKTLQMIDTMRKDLRRYLDELKLGDERRASVQDGDQDAERAELLAVLAASLQLASRLPAERKFKCLEATSASCAVHPSSLLEALSSPKPKHGRRVGCSDQEYSVLCWFSRMKTAELYLHDVSVVADVLPLLLLSPGVERRKPPMQAVFEVTCPTECHDAEETAAAGAREISARANAAHRDACDKSGAASEFPAVTATAAAPKVQNTVLRDSWEDSADSGEEVVDFCGLAEAPEQRPESRHDGDSDEEPHKLDRPPQTMSRRSVLLQVNDARLADMLWELRGHIQDLVDIIVGEPPFKLPQEVSAAFASLRQLLLASYVLHRDDLGACVVVSSPGSCSNRKGEDSEEDGPQWDRHDNARHTHDPGDRGGYKGSWRGKDKGKGKSKGKAAGKGGGGGYPWWEHLKPR